MIVAKAFIFTILGIIALSINAFTVHLGNKVSDSSSSKNLNWNKQRTAEFLPKCEYLENHSSLKTWNPKHPNQDNYDLQTSIEGHQWETTLTRSRTEPDTKLKQYQWRYFSKNSRKLLFADNIRYVAKMCRQFRCIFGGGASSLRDIIKCYQHYVTEYLEELMFPNFFDESQI